jgi:XTP/dITP diphosphohydrolase
MQKLLIATTNPGKLVEIKHYLADLPIELVGLSDVGITEKPEETGTTFKENAMLKAIFYAKRSKLPTLADDGGFEIEALNGEPGVKSHRWIHGDRDDDDKEIIAYTLKRMGGLPDHKRGARLRVVLALVLPDGQVHTVEASIDGIVPEKQSDRFTQGFPYRSLLYLPELGKFYDHNELTKVESDRYNHRKKALEQLRPTLISLLTK